MTFVKFRNSDFPTFPATRNDYCSPDRANYGSVNKTKGTLPGVNVKESADSFTLEVAAPGLKKENFNLELEKHQLKISAVTSEVKKEDETPTPEEKFTRREFHYRSFERYFNLPDSVDGDKITAKYEDGILMVHVPKKEEAKDQGPKSIKIK